MFLVPIRNPRTLLPLPGVLVGDMGEKVGLHGVDNGFMAFRNVKIPKQYLFNRLSDVADDGTFLSPQFKLEFFISRENFRLISSIMSKFKLERLLMFLLHEM